MTDTHAHRSLPAWFTCLIFAGAVLPSVGGCGSSNPGPPRFHVTGTATYQGAPIPYGEILFEPDAAQNNTGPGTTAVIEKGAFTTKKGKGAVSGPTIVHISGFDGKAPAGGGTQPHGVPLFKAFKAEIELPKKESTQTFDVPATK